MIISLKLHGSAQWKHTGAAPGCLLREGKMPASLESPEKADDWMSGANSDTFFFPTSKIPPNYHNGVRHYHHGHD